MHIRYLLKAIKPGLSKPSVAPGVGKILSRKLHSNPPDAKAVLWLGGTFDPPHNTHIHLALAAKQAMQAHEVKFMPVHLAPHKKNITAANHRREMVKLAVEDHPGLSVDLIEYERNQPSLTADTIKILRSRHPKTPIGFMIGMDSLLTFTTWDDWQDILNNAHLVVVDRPNYPLPSIGPTADLLKKHLDLKLSAIHESLGGKIFMCPTPLSDLSSTALRQNFASGHIPEDLLPPKVVEYIKSHQLYNVSPAKVDKPKLLTGYTFFHPPKALPVNNNVGTAFKNSL